MSSFPDAFEVRPVAGYVTITVPPVMDTFDGAVPCAAEPYAVHDHPGGEQHYGITGIRITTSCDGPVRETVADLDEIAQLDGTPAHTLAEVHRAGQDYVGAGIKPVTVRSRYLVVGYRLGKQHQAIGEPNPEWADDDD